jgi:D-glycero-alpha-D-manno-heptose-7-phosphate kinase
MACRIEIEILGEPVGKQDQYIAAYGGLMCFEIARDGSVSAEPLEMSREALSNLEDNLMLFFTGYSRSASGILGDQDRKSRSKDAGMIDNLHFVKQMGRDSRRALESGNLREFAGIMHIHWEHKKKRTAGMSNGCIDEYYRHALAHGALGGKLIGAGGGGFLMFYTEDKTRLRRAMLQAGLREVRFRFDHEGTRVVIQSQG